MNSYIKQPASWVFLILVMGTLVSWVLGYEIESEASLRFSSTGMILIAAVKIRLVIWYFMEVKDAPTPLKWLLDGWLILVTAGVLANYWFYLG